MEKSNFKFVTPIRTEYYSRGNTYHQNILAKTCTCRHGTIHIKAIAEGTKKVCRHLREILEWLRSISI